MVFCAGHTFLGGVYVSVDDPTWITWDLQLVPVLLTALFDVVSLWMIWRGVRSLDTREQAPCQTVQIPST